VSSQVENEPSRLPSARTPIAPPPIPSPMTRAQPFRSPKKRARAPVPGRLSSPPERPLIRLRASASSHRRMAVSNWLSRPAVCRPHRPRRRMFERTPVLPLRQALTPAEAVAVPRLARERSQPE
jgi:hypothetical protein